MVTLAEALAALLHEDAKGPLAWMIDRLKQDPVFNDCSAGYCIHGRTIILNELTFASVRRREDYGARKQCNLIMLAYATFDYNLKLTRNYSVSALSPPPCQP